MSNDARSTAVLLRPTRRRSGASKLGAVRRAGTAEDRSFSAPSPDPSMASSSGGSGAATPLVLSPTQLTASGTGSARAAERSNTQQFTQLLSQTNVSERWFSEQIAPPCPGVHAGRPRDAASLPAQPIENAASQIVHKALSFVTQAPAEAPGQQRSASKLEAGSLLDKGLDAITGVGKLMEGFALTLDNVIGQAFEEWVPSKGARDMPVTAATAQAFSQRRTPLREANTAPASGAAGVQHTAAAAHWGDFDLGSRAGDENHAPAGAAKAASKKSDAARDPPRQACLTSFMSKMDAASEQDVQEWQQRAQQLAQELQQLRIQQEEYQRLQHHVSKLSEENSQLKRRSLPLEAGPAIADPLAQQQVTRQMELLLHEKAKLAEQNAQLLRENTGLQELLEYTMMHHAEFLGDEQLFGGEDEDCLSEAAGGGNAACANALAHLNLQEAGDMSLQL